MVHVLVPTDGSPLSTAALDHALEHFPGARITVLHVVDPLEVVYAAEAGGPRYAEERVDLAVEHGEEIVGQARDRAADHDGDVTAVTEVGKPARVVVDYVADHGVDHVVLGSHGRRGLSRLVLGSVAETVLRQVTVPVTVVR